jgi:hypothetical protein
MSATIDAGYCQCGCGGKAPIAPQNHTARGLVKGQPMQFIAHHQNRRVQPEDPNPSGLCQCGCGQETPIGKRTRAGRGLFQGQHARFVPRHHPRKYQPGYAIDPVTGCWNWTGAKNGAYGSIAKHRGSVPAHVYHYQEKYGPVPEGKELHHKCRNTACCNPDHVEPLTRAEHVKADRALRALDAVTA